MYDYFYVSSGDSRRLGPLQLLSTHVNNLSGIARGWREEVGIVQTWWRHDVETLVALLALCEGNPSATGGFPSQSGQQCAIEEAIELPV